MGALHAGHLHLMTTSATQNPTTIASIFVNPLQFGPNDDLSKYPRQEQQDVQLAQTAGVNAIFIPTANEMVGTNATRITVSGVTDLYEGQKRPGHFEGVATIVAQLFGLVEPTNAYFGLKDLQQCAVIRQMVADLCFNINLKFIETVREPTGLAMSSRNAYFTPQQKLDAAILYQTLIDCRSQIVDKQINPTLCIPQAIDLLKAHHFDVEYLDLVNFATMKPVNTPSSNARLVAAARFHGVRLIDNMSCS